MNHRTLLHALTIIGLGVTTALAAEEQPMRRMRIDVRGGAMVAESDPSIDINGQTRRARSDADAAVGLGVGYALTEHFDAALDGDWANDGSPSQIVNAAYSSLTAGARYYPIGRNRIVRPWLLGEAGWYRGDAKTVKTVPGGFIFDKTIIHRAHDGGGGLNIGAGIDVPVGHLVSLGAGVRYNKTLGVFDDPSFLTTMAQVSFHFWE